MKERDNRNTKAMSLAASSVRSAFVVSVHYCTAGRCGTTECMRSEWNMFVCISLTLRERKRKCIRLFPIAHSYNSSARTRNIHAPSKKTEQGRLSRYSPAFRSFRIRQWKVSCIFTTLAIKTFAQDARRENLKESQRRGYTLHEI